MKTIVILFLLGCLGCYCTSCKSAGDPVKDQIPGTYVRTFKGPYAIGWDTLRISVLSQKAGNFQVVRNTTIEQWKDKVKLPVKHLVKQWVAVYDKSSMQLMDYSTLEVISFVPESTSLRLGNLEFIRLR